MNQTRASSLETVEIGTELRPKHKCCGFQFGDGSSDVTEVLAAASVQFKLAAFDWHK